MKCDKCGLDVDVCREYMTMHRDVAAQLAIEKARAEEAEARCAKLEASVRTHVIATFPDAERVRELEIIPAEGSGVSAELQKLFFAALHAKDAAEAKLAAAVETLRWYADTNTYSPHIESGPIAFDCDRGLTTKDRDFGISGQRARDTLRALGIDPSREPGW